MEGLPKVLVFTNKIRYRYNFIWFGEDFIRFIILHLQHLLHILQFILWAYTFFAFKKINNIFSTLTYFGIKCSFTTSVSYININKAKKKCWITIQDCANHIYQILYNFQQGLNLRLSWVINRLFQLLLIVTFSMKIIRF